MSDSADRHWSFVRGLLAALRLDNRGDLAFGEASARYLYVTAWDHGFRHGASGDSPGSSRVLPRERDALWGQWQKRFEDLGEEPRGRESDSDLAENS